MVKGGESQMTTTAIKNHVVQKFGKAPEEIDPFESVSTSLEEVERLIKWLGYVSDSEFTETERVKIIDKARTFAATLQPIASKYLD
jgi:hypothetical protein